MRFSEFFQLTEAKTSLYPWVEALRKSRGNPADFLMFADWLDDNRGDLGNSVAQAIREAIKLAELKSRQESEGQDAINEDEWQKAFTNAIHELEKYGIRPASSIYGSRLVVNGKEIIYNPQKMIIAQPHRKRSTRDVPHWEEIALTDVDDENLQLAGILLTAAAIADRSIPIFPRGVHSPSVFESLLNDFAHAYNWFIQDPHDAHAWTRITNELENIRRAVTKVRKGKHGFYKAIEHIGNLETYLVRLETFLERIGSEADIQRTVRPVRQMLWKMIKDYENAPVAFRIVNNYDEI